MLNSKTQKPSLSTSKRQIRVLGKSSPVLWTASLTQVYTAVPRIQGWAYRENGLGLGVLPQLPVRKISRLLSTLAKAKSAELQGRSDGPQYALTIIVNREWREDYLPRSDLSFKSQVYNNSLAGAPEAYHLHMASMPVCSTGAVSRGLLRKQGRK